MITNQKRWPTRARTRTASRTFPPLASLIKMVIKVHLASTHVTPAPDLVTPSSTNPTRPLTRDNWAKSTVEAVTRIIHHHQPIINAMRASYSCVIYLPLHRHHHPDNNSNIRYNTKTMLNINDTLISSLYTVYTIHHTHTHSLASFTYYTRFANKHEFKHDSIMTTLL